MSWTALLGVVLVPALALPEALRVELLSQQRPRAVSVPSAAAASCDGRPLGAAGPLSFTWAGGRVRAGRASCRRVALLPLPSAGGRCGGRPGLEVQVGGLRRCVEGALEVTASREVLRLVAAVPLERYVASVVASELSGGPAAALEAQAVVTRSWALSHRGRHGDADACDLAHCQVLHGEVTPGAEAAALATRGRVLLQDGEVVRASFHGACGGHTADARAVFGEAGPEPVPDMRPGGAAYCAEAPWTLEVTREELARALGLPPRGGVAVAGRWPDGRVRALEAFGRRVAGPRFLAQVERALGYGRLRSLRFRVEAAGERLRFTGEGRGHGVGLCQAGAVARARAGADAAALLRAYFPRAISVVP